MSSKNRTYEIVVERQIAEEGRSLDEIYVEYLAERIAEFVKNMSKDTVAEKV